MITFTNHEKRALGQAGRGPYGRELVLILKRVGTEIASIDGITGGDYGAQVEGRRLFKQMNDILISALESGTRTIDGKPKNLDGTEYE